MDDILDLLYAELCPGLSSLEEQAVLKREEAFLDGMEEWLGRDDFARFWDTVSEIGCCRAQAEFRLGFWLGANLVLTAKAPPFPQK